jgi:organic radical activating enzyme
MKELKQFGNYPTTSIHHAYPSEDKIPITDSSTNPYVKYFWEWWPDLYNDLKVLRITGGEPLLVPDTFKVLDYVSTHKNTELSLAINTNLGTDKKFVEKAVAKIHEIQDSKNVKDITLYTSLDTWGKQAEYIRFGLDLDLFQKNLIHVLENAPLVNIVFMCTYNLLSVAGFRDFLEFILELKNKYKDSHNNYQSRITLDISYLKDPYFMCANLVDNELLEMMKSDLNFMTANSDKYTTASGKIGFTDYELNKMVRLVGYAGMGVEDTYRLLQSKDFYVFFHEYDRRRGTNFLETFPQYNKIWNAGEMLSS